MNIKKHAHFDFTRTEMGAAAVGARAMAQGAFERALRYSTQREQFGQPIQMFQMTQLKIAEMAMKIDAARLLTYRNARLIDHERGNRQLITKCVSIASAR